MRWGWMRGVGGGGRCDVGVARCCAGAGGGCGSGWLPPAPASIGWSGRLHHKSQFVSVEILAGRSRAGGLVRILDEFCTTRLAGAWRAAVVQCSAVHAAARFSVGQGTASNNGSRFAAAFSYRTLLPSPFLLSRLLINCKWLMVQWRRRAFMASAVAQPPTAPAARGSSAHDDYGGQQRGKWWNGGWRGLFSSHVPASQQAVCRRTQWYS